MERRCRRYAIWLGAGPPQSIDSRVRDRRLPDTTQTIARPSADQMGVVIVGAVVRAISSHDGEFALSARRPGHSRRGHSMGTPVSGVVYRLFPRVRNAGTRR